MSVSTDILVEEQCCVISDGGKIRGYKKEIIVENLSKREIVFLICPRCQGILRDACLLTNGEQACLCCTNKDEESIGNTSVNNTVLSLKCACPLSKRGCEWLGVLGNCEDHLASCSHVNEPCKLACGVILQRCEVSYHLKELCVRRELECEGCTEKYIASDMYKHMIECGDGCGMKVCQNKIESHREKECVMKCPFEKYNCGVGVINRRKMMQHLDENKTLHTELKLSAMEDTIEQQSSMMHTMNQQIEALRAELNGKDGAGRISSTSEDIQIEPIKELTEKVGKLTKDLFCLTKYLENKTEQTRDLKEILQLHHPTEKFRIKIAGAEDIFKKGVHSFGSSEVFQFKGYKFKFSHETIEDSLFVYFTSQSGQFCDHLPWPFTAEFITRLISHSDQSKTMEFKSKRVEINKDEFKCFSRGKELAKIPISTEFVTGYFRKGNIEMEIFLVLHKNK